MSGGETQELAWRRSRPRPGPPKTGWILIVTAVTVVILIGLTLWSIGTWGLGGVEKPADTEEVHALVLEWQDRWAQVPGPSERYRAEADAAARAGRYLRARDRLTMALALDPDDTDALLQLAILAGRHPQGEILADDELDAVILAVEETLGDHRLLPAARAWRALRQGDAPGALAAVGEAPATLAARQARLRALRELDRPALDAAEAVLEYDPGDLEACTLAGRLHAQQGRPWTVLRLLERCRASAPEGAAPPPSWAATRASSLDVLGRSEAAAAVYAQAGLVVHAVQLRVQEGLGVAESLRVRLAEEPDPHRARAEVQLGILAGEAALVARAVERTEGLGGEGAVAEVRLGRAMGLAWLGRHAEAVEEVGEIEGAAGLVLLARARRAAGDEQGALEALGRALEQEPWVGRLHHVNLAWSAEAGPAALEAARARVAAVPPLVRLAFMGHADRDLPWPALLPDPLPPLAAAELALLAALEEPVDPAELPLPAEGEEGDLIDLIALIEGLRAARGGQQAVALEALSRCLAEDPRRWGCARVAEGLLEQ